MEHQEENEAIVEPDEDGGWVDTHHHVDVSGVQVVPGGEESFSEMTLESEKVFTLNFFYLDSSMSTALEICSETNKCKS